MVHIGGQEPGSLLLHLAEVLGGDAHALADLREGEIGHRELALALEGKGLAVFEHLELPRVGDEVRFGLRLTLDLRGEFGE